MKYKIHQTFLKPSKKFQNTTINSEFQLSFFVIQLSILYITVYRLHTPLKMQTNTQTLNTSSDSWNNCERYFLLKHWFWAQVHFSSSNLVLRTLCKFFWLTKDPWTLVLQASIMFSMFSLFSINSIYANSIVMISKSIYIKTHNNAHVQYGDIPNFQLLVI
jgi:hypothetical protein